MRAGQDSNLRPLAPEANALSTELPAHGVAMIAGAPELAPALGLAMGGSLRLAGDAKVDAVLDL